MSRPVTKEELTKLASDKYSKLFDLIESLSIEEQNGTFEMEGKEAHWCRDKNIRDILIHLYEWHQLLLNWVTSNKAGIDKQFLLEPYNWKTYGEMNVEFWKKHQDTSYGESINLISESHVKIMELLDSFSDEELFVKNVFAFVGGSTLGSYFISVTSSHYDWAMKKIGKYKKSLNLEG